MALNIGDTVCKYDPSNIVGHDFLHNFLDKPRANGNCNLFVVKRIAYDSCWAYKLSNFDWISDSSHKIMSGRVLLIESVESKLNKYFEFQKKNKFSGMYKNNLY
jgi:hypothetical protein